MSETAIFFKRAQIALIIIMIGIITIEGYRWYKAQQRPTYIPDNLHNIQCEGESWVVYIPPEIKNLESYSRNYCQQLNL